MWRWLNKHLFRLRYWLPSSSYGFYRCYMYRHQDYPRECYPDPVGAAPLPPGERAKVIAMSPPGTGWADRLNGIVSIWGLCKQYGWKFGIWFQAPFALEDYLLPAEVDWRVDPREVDFANAAPVICCWISFRSTPYARRYLREHIGRHALTHAYTNIALCWDDYSTLFRELFRPAPVLEALLEQYAAQIGDNYVAAVFRFQELLGDFDEGNLSPTLPEGTQREALIARCLAELQRVREENPEAGRVLVTSDSPTFLKRAAEAFEWVYTTPGRVVHMAHSVDAPMEDYLKSFVDFYMLMRARKVYRIRDARMYHSGFPQIAARVGKAAFFDRRF